MADKLTLRGVKRIESYTKPAAIADRAFTLKRPITGKDQFTIKRWWTEAGNRVPKRYVNCTLLDIARTGDDYVLAVVSNQDTRLTITYDDTDPSLIFSEIHAVERIAVFSSDLATLHYDYVIPKIPGVKPARIEINAIADTTAIGTVTITGPATASDGVETAAYSAAMDGGATSSQVEYAWSSTDGSATFGTETAASTTVTFNATGTFTVSCTVTAKNGQPISDGPTTGTSGDVVVS